MESNEKTIVGARKLGRKNTIGKFATEKEACDCIMNCLLSK